MEGPRESNRSLWNWWTRLHASSDYYDVPAFRAGRTTLKHVEREELAKVRGCSLLHLQCHFGLDTLSWARLGARVTGVDLSDDAIALARSLSAELGIDAEFIRSDVYALPEVLDSQFDIVYASYGVLCWLRDLPAWGRLIARYLKPGGTFYMVEFHPVVTTLDDDGERVRHPYFGAPEPQRYEVQGSYAVYEGGEPHEVFEWQHTLADVVNALLDAGLRIEFLHEFPYTVEPYAGFLVQEAPERFVLRDRPNTLPLMFSIRATH